jgi:hypothetical protein
VASLQKLGLAVYDQVRALLLKSLCVYIYYVIIYIILYMYIQTDRQRERERESKHIYDQVPSNQALEPLFRFANREVLGMKFVDMLGVCACVRACVCVCVCVL